MRADPDADDSDDFHFAEGSSMIVPFSRDSGSCGDTSSCDDTSSGDDTATVMHGRPQAAFVGNDTTHLQRVHKFDNLLHSPACLLPARS